MSHSHSSDGDRRPHTLRGELYFHKEGDHLRELRDILLSHDFVQVPNRMEYTADRVQVIFAKQIPNQKGADWMKPFSSLPNVPWTHVNIYADQGADISPLVETLRKSNYIRV